MTNTTGFLAGKKLLITGVLSNRSDAHCTAPRALFGDRHCPS